MSESMRGVYVTSSATGFYYRQLGGTRPRPRVYQPRPELPLEETAIYATETVASVGVDSLSDLAQEDLVASINEWTTRGWLQVTAVALTAIVLIVAAASGSAAAVAELLAYGVIGIVLARFIELRRRRFHLMFDLGETQAAQYQRLQSALRELATSCSLGSVAQIGYHGDWKRHGGATSKLTLDAVRLRQATPPHVVTNVAPWRLTVQGMELYFFPDRVLIRRRQRFAALSYDQLDAASEQKRIVWSELPVPNDARVVDHTWQYVRRDGGADGRFKENRRIPVVLVAYVTLQSATGLDVVLQTTKVAAAEVLAREHYQYRRTAAVRPPGRATPLSAPLATLGFNEMPTRDALDQRYRELAARNRPETLTQLSQELRVFASQRMAELRAAYDAVLAQLGAPRSTADRALVPLTPSVESPRWKSVERLALIAASSAALSIFAGARVMHCAPAVAASAEVASAEVVPAAVEVTPVRAVANIARVVAPCPLRAKPSLSSQVIAGIAVGTQLEVFEQRGGWRRVRNPAGRDGWTGPACWQAVTKPKRPAHAKPRAIAPPKPTAPPAAVESTTAALDAPVVRSDAESVVPTDRPGTETAAPLDPYAESSAKQSPP